MIKLNRYFLYCLFIIAPFESSFSQNERTVRYDSIEVKDNNFGKINTGKYEKLKKEKIIIYSHESRLIGKDAVSFTFSSYDGQKISLNQYKGKILVLDFWESWCAKCIHSFPDVNRIAMEYKPKGIEILGITTGNKKAVKKLIKSNKLIYTNIFADKTITNDYEVSARPTYVIVNEEGKIIFVSHGNLSLIEKKLKQITGS